MGLQSLLFERPKNTGSRFGFLSILLIAIALVFPVFYGIGNDSEAVQAYSTLLLAGLVMTLFFSYLYSNITRTKRQPKGMSPADIQKQMNVLVFGIIGGALLVLVNGFTNQGANWLLGSAIGNISPEAIYLGLLAGVAEELFFRGFIQTMIRVYVPSLIMAIVPTAIIFALFHFFAYQTTTAFVVLFMLGLFLGILHEMFNDIGVPMIAHIVNNIFAMLGTVIALITGNMVIIVLVVGIMIAVYLVASARRN